jgi:hypothetical protein
MAAVAANLARAPESPRNFTANGNAVQGVTIKFNQPEGGHVDHFVIAARSVNENFYRQRITISHDGEGQVISAQALGLNPGDSFFVSVASVDERGHESLFAYPEVRCDSNACAIPPYANNVTAPLPPPAKEPADEDD